MARSQARHPVAIEHDIPPALGFGEFDTIRQDLLAQRAEARERAGRPNLDIDGDRTNNFDRWMLERESSGFFRDEEFLDQRGVDSRIDAMAEINSLYRLRYEESSPLAEKDEALEDPIIDFLSSVAYIGTEDVLQNPERAFLRNWSIEEKTEALRAHILEQTVRDPAFRDAFADHPIHGRLAGRTIAAATRSEAATFKVAAEIISDWKMQGSSDKELLELSLTKAWSVLDDLKTHHEKNLPKQDDPTLQDSEAPIGRAISQWVEELSPDQTTTQTVSPAIFEELALAREQGKRASLSLALINATDTLTQEVLNRRIDRLANNFPLTQIIFSSKTGLMRPLTLDPSVKWTEIGQNDPKNTMKELLQKGADGLLVLGDPSPYKPHLPRNRVPLLTSETPQEPQPPRARNWKIYVTGSFRTQNIDGSQKSAEDIAAETTTLYRALDRLQSLGMVKEIIHTGTSTPIGEAVQGWANLNGIPASAATINWALKDDALAKLAEPAMNDRRRDGIIRLIAAAYTQNDLNLPLDQLLSGEKFNRLPRSGQKELIGLATLSDTQLATRYAIADRDYRIITDKAPPDAVFVFGTASAIETMCAARHLKIAVQRQFLKRPSAQELLFEKTPILAYADRMMPASRSVDGLRGDYQALSFFGPAEIRLSGSSILWPSLQHAVASMVVPEDLHQNLSSTTPRGAKEIIGLIHHAKNPFEIYRNDIAKQLDLCLRQKFGIGVARNELTDIQRANRTVLLSTGLARIVDANGYGDKFFGYHLREGLNLHGQALERARSAVREEHMAAIASRAEMTKHGMYIIEPNGERRTVLKYLPTNTAGSLDGKVEILAEAETFAGSKNIAIAHDRDTKRDLALAQNLATAQNGAGSMAARFVRQINSNYSVAQG